MNECVGHREKEIVCVCVCVCMCVCVTYLICGISDSERPQRVVSEGLAAFQGHLVRAVFFLVLLRPVLVTFCLYTEDKDKTRADDQ